jgi:hypothetical protein
MTFSKTSRNLSVLAILVVTAFFASSAFRGDKLRGFSNAPLNQSGAVVTLQADGGAPPPPLPPSTPPGQSQSSASVA